MRKLAIEVETFAGYERHCRVKYLLDQDEVQTILQDGNDEGVDDDTAESLLAYLVGTGEDSTFQKLRFFQADIDRLVHQICEGLDGSSAKIVSTEVIKEAYRTDNFMEGSAKVSVIDVD